MHVSRARNCTRPIEIVEKPETPRWARLTARSRAPRHAAPRRLHRRPHGGVPWFTIGNGAWGHGFYARRCFWWVRVHSAEPMRQILDSEKYRVARLWAICCLWETRDGDCLLVMDGKWTSQIEEKIGWVFWARDFSDFRQRDKDGW